MDAEHPQQDGLAGQHDTRELTQHERIVAQDGTRHKLGVELAVREVLGEVGCVRRRKVDEHDGVGIHVHQGGRHREEEVSLRSGCILRFGEQGDVLDGKEGLGGLQQRINHHTQGLLYDLDGVLEDELSRDGLRIVTEGYDDAVALQREGGGGQDVVGGYHLQRGEWLKGYVPIDVDSCPLRWDGAITLQDETIDIVLVVEVVSREASQIDDDFLAGPHWTINLEVECHESNCIDIVYPLARLFLYDRSRPPKYITMGWAVLSYENVPYTNDWSMT